MAYDFIFLVCVAAVITVAFAVVTAAIAIGVEKVRERRATRRRVAHAKREGRDS